MMQEPMKTTARPTRTIRRGAALVEFAVVLPLLLLVVFGIIEFGQVAFVRHGLINAATQGARAAILPGASEASVQAIVDQALKDGGLDKYAMEWGREKMYVSGVGEDAAADVGRSPLSETVTIRVAYSEISLIGMFGEFNIGSTCTMYRGPLD